MLNYTKGEWKVEVDTYDGTTNIATEYQNIAKMCYDDKHTLKANAHLMASAPDLYEALSGLLKRYVSLVNSGDCGFWNPKKEAEVINSRKALTKAEGNVD